MIKFIKLGNGTENLNHLNVTVIATLKVTLFYFFNFSFFLHQRNVRCSTCDPRQRQRAQAQGRHRRPVRGLLAQTLPYWIQPRNGTL